MLCRRFNKIQHIQSLLTRHTQIRSFGILKSKCLWRNSVFATLKPDPMSSYKLRLILRGFTVNRLWNACFRTQLVSTVARRCRRDRVRVWSCLRQTLLRPSRTLLLSVAAYNGDDDEDDDEGGPEPCSQDVSDEDLEALIHDFEGVDDLSRTTLFCPGCQRRVIIDKKHPGVLYCACPNTQPPTPSEDGWVPYMESDDVIIWRKEYKPGGLFAYKVYGRYKDLTASDFAMIQVDGAYRRSWDDAVAALSIVEREANGVRSQTVLHWEVMWPRLFANRDYVYLRRHKEFDVKSACLAHMEAIFSNRELEACSAPKEKERPSVHSRAKLKAMEAERRERRGTGEDQLNKVYVIVSRSCTHPEAPETKHAIRVQEYWSHMVVRTLHGPHSAGMEFVLTYYDEPSVGGLPPGVSAWAAGRAAPAYLARMRRAAHHYAAFRKMHRNEPADFEPFDAEAAGPRAVDHRAPRKLPAVPLSLNELDMESSKQGPELDGGYEPRDMGTQTDAQDKARRDVGVDPIIKQATETSSDLNAAQVTDKVKAQGDVKPAEKAKRDEVKVTDKVKSSDKVKVTDEVKVTEKVETSDESKETEKVEAEHVKDKVKSKESSKQGPELDGGYEPRDMGTQTDAQDKARRDVGVDPIIKQATETSSDLNAAQVTDKVKAQGDVKPAEKAKRDEVKVTDKVKSSDKVKVTDEVKVTEKVETSDESKETEKVEAEHVKDKVKSKEVESKEATESESKEEQSDESEGEKNSSWWRYLYPFYYFV